MKNVADEVVAAVYRSFGRDVALAVGGALRVAAAKWDEGDTEMYGTLAANTIRSWFAHEGGRGQLVAVDRVELLRLLDEDPQQLIDSGQEFEFNEVDGRVKLIDGVAAGTEFQEFEFVSGPYAGKKLFCSVDYDGGKVCGWLYDVNVNSDGFLFNWDPSDDVSNIGDGEVTGGDYLPELDGVYLTLRAKKGEN